MPALSSSLTFHTRAQSGYGGVQWRWLAPDSPQGWLRSVHYHIGDVLEHLLGTARAGGRGEGGGSRAEEAFGDGGGGRKEKITIKKQTHKHTDISVVGQYKSMYCVTTHQGAQQVRFHRDHPTNAAPNPTRRDRSTLQIKRVCLYDPIQLQCTTRL